MLLVRLVMLYAGLVLYGLSSAMMVRADLGLDPWNVLHAGLARHLDLSFGTIIIGVGALLMLLWVPLRQRPGLGTVSNVVVIGVAADAALRHLAQPHALYARAGMMVAAVAINGVATGMYIGAGFGPGPRDGLMTGIAARNGWSIRAARTAIEVCVLSAGWLLGGTVGFGTVVYAASIGAVVQGVLPAFRAIGKRRISSAHT